MGHSGDGMNAPFGEGLEDFDRIIAHYANENAAARIDPKVVDAAFDIRQRNCSRQDERRVPARWNTLLGSRSEATAKQDREAEAVNPNSSA